MSDVFPGFFRSFLRILFKVNAFVFWMVAICLPCIVYFVFLSIGQGVHEDSNGFQVSKVGGLEVFSKVARGTSTSNIGIMSQVDNFWKERTFEFSMGFFKILFVPPAFAEEMDNQCPDSRPDKSQYETIPYIYITHTELWIGLSLLFGAICGSLITVFWNNLLNT